MAKGRCWFWQHCYHPEGTVERLVRDNGPRCVKLVPSTLYKKKCCRCDDAYEYVPVFHGLDY